MAASRGDFDRPTDRQLSFDFREVRLSFALNGLCRRGRKRRDLLLARQKTQGAV